MAHDVFISYATPDKTIADAICAGLENAGIRCWIAPRDIHPSEDFDDAIIRAINNAKLAVVIFSSNVCNSKWAKGEIQAAFEKELPIIPVRIEPVEAQGGLELLLGRKHWLDALTRPIENHIEKLVESIRAILSISDASLPGIKRPFNQQSRFSERTVKKIQTRRIQPVYVVFIAVILLAGLGGGVWWGIRHENETRKKNELVSQINTAVSDIMTAVQIVEGGKAEFSKEWTKFVDPREKTIERSGSPVRKGGETDPGQSGRLYTQEKFDEDFREWESRRAVIKSQIQFLFPRTRMEEEWRAYSDFIVEVYALSGTYMPEIRSARLNGLQAYLVSNKLDKNIGWSVLAKIEYRGAEYEKEQEFFRAWNALKDQVLKKKDEIVKKILN